MFFEDGPVHSPTAPSTRTIEVVDSFRGRYAWASNYHESPVVWQDIEYPTSEAGFHAGKTLDPVLRREIAAAATPAEAKHMGHALTLRPDWDRRWRYEVMRDVLTAKFLSENLARRLRDTGTALLIEGNRHHDRHWGCCGCSRHLSTPGANMLGRYLMALRAQLNPDLTGQWTRVACTGHRAELIPPDSVAWVRQELARVAAKLAEQYGTRVAISGGMTGADLWWEHAAAAAGVSTWLYAPFHGQDRRWPPEWREAYAAAAARASRTVVLGPQFGMKLLHNRNRLMLRDADALVVVCDPRRSSGGTVRTASAAQGRMPVIRLNVLARTVTVNNAPVDLWAPDTAMAAYGNHRREPKVSS